MKLKFFFHKMREVGSFLKIMRGKVTGNTKDRVEGVDDALKAMKDEKEQYLDEKQQALNKQPQASQEKVLRESGGQDISAI